MATPKKPNAKRGAERTAAARAVALARHRQAAAAAAAGDRQQEVIEAARAVVRCLPSNHRHGMQFALSQLRNAIEKLEQGRQLIESDSSPWGPQQLEEL